MDDHSPEEIAQRALDGHCAQVLGFQTIRAESAFGRSLYLWDEGAIRDATGARHSTTQGP